MTFSKLGRKLASLLLVGLLASCGLMEPPPGVVPPIGTTDTFDGGGNFLASIRAFRANMTRTFRLMATGAYVDRLCDGVPDMTPAQVASVRSLLVAAAPRMESWLAKTPIRIVAETLTDLDPAGSRHPVRGAFVRGRNADGSDSEVRIAHEAWVSDPTSVTIHEFLHGVMPQENDYGNVPEFITTGNSATPANAAGRRKLDAAGDCVNAYFTRYVAFDAEPAADFGEAGITAVPQYSESATMARQGDFVLVALNRRRLLANGRDYVYYVTVERRSIRTGALDTTFGSGGTLTLPTDPATPPNGGRNIQRIVVASDERFYLVGTTKLVLYHPTLWRFDRDGKVLDTAFNQKWWRLHAGAPSNRFYRDAVLQSDGKIVVAGTIAWQGQHHITVWRHNEDGSADNTFSGDGAYVLPNQNAHESATALALGAGGSIITVGQRTGGVVVLFKLDARGALAAGFGPNDNGIFRTKFLEGASDVPGDLVVLPDGKLLVVGTATVQGVSRGVLFRLRPGGVPDVSYGTAGRVFLSSLTPFSQSALLDAEPLADEKVLVTGWAIHDGVRRALVARVLPTGLLDETFRDEAGSTWSLLNATAGPTYGRRSLLLPGGRYLTLATYGASTGAPAGWFLAALLGDDGN